MTLAFGGPHGGMGASPMRAMFDRQRRQHGRDAHATIAKDVAARISMEDLATLRMLEDRDDLKPARGAIAEAKKKGTVK